MVAEHSNACAARRKKTVRYTSARLCGNNCPRFVPPPAHPPHPVRPSVVRPFRSIVGPGRCFGDRSAGWRLRRRLLCESSLLSLSEFVPFAQSAPRPECRARACAIPRPGKIKQQFLIVFSTRRKCKTQKYEIQAYISQFLRRRAGRDVRNCRSHSASAARVLASSHAATRRAHIHRLVLVIDGFS